MDKDKARTDGGLQITTSTPASFALLDFEAAIITGTGVVG